MSLVIRFNGRNDVVLKALVVAKLTQTTLVETQDAACVTPTLDTPEGSLTKCDAILKFLARSEPGKSLSGTTLKQQADVNQWLEFTAAELIPAVSLHEKESEPLSRALEVINAHLLDNTYLVGNTVTLADVVVVVALKGVSAPAALLGLQRLLTTCSNQPAFKTTLTNDNNNDDNGNNNDDNTKTSSPVAPAAEANLVTSLRSHTCGQLRLTDEGNEVTLCGWVQTARDMNHFAFVDVRDRYGITQCVFPNTDATKALYTMAQKLGREFVVKVTGTVKERSNKNKNRTTGEIEVIATSLDVLNVSKTPPFIIEDKTDALEETRMRYRYLDIRRNPVREALILRSKLAMIVRNYLTNEMFVEVETPVLIKSTPEGARDFVVPSRMNPGQFYALPQSPQTFKQLLMVGGLDRYFQIVKCFRDEELRADRQPEFTQIDCEMSFVSQDDILNLFEGMVRKIFKEIVGHEFPPFQRMPYSQAMKEYGIDKPDLRFAMKLVELNDIAKGKGLKMFDEAELVVGVCCEGVGKMSSKKVKELEKMAKSHCQAPGLVWVKCTSLKKGALKIASSVDKFFTKEDLAQWAERFGAKDGDLLCVTWGATTLKAQDAMGRFRHEMGTRLGLRTGGFVGLWVVDFPLLEFNEDEDRYQAMHHPFTSPKPEDMHMLKSNPGAVRANAYDMVINGVEMGGGSIRIFNRDLQHTMFDLLGFTREQAEEQFGFLLGAFEFGAPPHGGLAFGFDRMCTILGHAPSIRDYIAFPKNNMGRDTMIASPSVIDDKQMTELCLKTVLPTVDSKEEKKQ